MAHTVQRGILSDLRSEMANLAQGARDCRDLQNRAGTNLLDSSVDDDCYRKAPTHSTIVDTNPHLVGFCKTLETALRHGSLNGGSTAPTLSSKAFNLIDILNAMSTSQSSSATVPLSGGFIRTGHVRLNSMLVSAVKDIKADGSKKSAFGFPCTSTVGKSRLILRAALNNHWLLNICESIRTWPESLSYYSPDALVLAAPRKRPQGSGSTPVEQETLWDIVQSLSATFKFKLDLANRVFLDRTWELPNLVRYQFLTDSDLGLVIFSADGVPVVTYVKKGSVAAEDHKVEVGDLLVDFGGASAFGRSPEELAKTVRQFEKKPLSVTVLKMAKEVKKAGAGLVFLPAVSLLSKAGLDVRKLEIIWQRNREELGKWNRPAQGRRLTSKRPPQLADCADDDDEEVNQQLLELSALLEDAQVLEDDDDDVNCPEDDSSEANEDPEGLLSIPGASPIRGKAGCVRDMYMARTGYQVLYIGSISVGSVGDKAMLDTSIDLVAKDPGRTDHPVSLHLLEFGVRMYCAKSARQVLHCPYPQISSCGCSSANTHYLAFIVGDNLCALADGFMCHVFFSKDRSVAEEMISNMASGFRRTHHAA